MGYTLFHLFRRLIARFTFFIATIKVRIRCFVNYHVTKGFYRYKVVKKLDYFSDHGLAIVALYPRRGILMSVTRLVDSLISSNYSVLVVVNESDFSTKWLDALEKKPIEILTRPNNGRDFGAYKIGFLHAEKSGYLHGAEHLLFANDSVFYGPNSINFVRSMLKLELPWQAMFVNYQFHIHAQSFFQVFRKEIFLTNNFANFWHDYYPSELRHKAINSGEVGLSKITLSMGISPIGFVKAKLIFENPDFINFTHDEIFGILDGNLLAFTEKDFGTLENFYFLMRRQYLDRNISHNQGLLASRVLKAPLKLDIFQTGQVTLEGVADTLISLGLEEDEATEVLNVMTLKGTHSSRLGFQKLWGSYGYV
jgi:hypothetical protein